MLMTGSYEKGKPSGQCFRYSVFGKDAGRARRSFRRLSMFFRWGRIKGRLVQSSHSLLFKVQPQYPRSSLHLRALAGRGLCRRRVNEQEDLLTAEVCTAGELCRIGLQNCLPREQQQQQLCVGVAKLVVIRAHGYCRLPQARALIHPPRGSQVSRR